MFRKTNTLNLFLIYVIEHSKLISKCETTRKPLLKRFGVKYIF